MPCLATAAARRDDTTSSKPSYRRGSPRANRHPGHIAPVRWPDPRSEMLASVEFQLRVGVHQELQIPGFFLRTPHPTVWRSSPSPARPAAASRGCSRE